jgi:hypothetical protein
MTAWQSKHGQEMARSEAEPRLNSLVKGHTSVVDVHNFAFLHFGAKILDQFHNRLVSFVLPSIQT